MTSRTKAPLDTRPSLPPESDPVPGAWGMGYDAAREGIDYDDNPFDPLDQPKSYSEWAAGHIDANR